MSHPRREEELSLSPPSLFISSSKMVSAPPTPFYPPEEVRNPLPSPPLFLLPYLRRVNLRPILIRDRESSPIRVRLPFPSQVALGHWGRIASGYPLPPPSLLLSSVHFLIDVVPYSCIRYCILLIRTSTVSDHAFCPDIARDCGSPEC